MACSEAERASFPLQAIEGKKDRGCVSRNMDAPGESRLGKGTTIKSEYMDVSRLSLAGRCYRSRLVIKRRWRAKGGKRKESRVK